MRRGSLSPHKDVLIGIDPPGGPALGSDLGERSRNLYKHSLVRIEYKKHFRCWRLTGSSAGDGPSQFGDCPLVGSDPLI